MNSALAKQGKSVVQIDSRSEYGGTSSTLPLSSLIGSFIFKILRNKLETNQLDINFSVEDWKALVRDFERRILIDYSPILIPASSLFVDTLVHSTVHQYVDFKLITEIWAYLDDSNGDDSKPKRENWVKVPLNKEQVFASSNLQLIEKRKIMKFMVAVQQKLSSEKIISDNADRSFLSLLDTEYGIQGKLAAILLAGLLIDPCILRFIT